jgi:hypothetical protein
MRVGLQGRALLSLSIAALAVTLASEVLARIREKIDEGLRLP